MISKPNMSNNSIYNNYINNERIELYNNSNELFQNSSAFYFIYLYLNDIFYMNKYK